MKEHFPSTSSEHIDKDLPTSDVSELDRQLEEASNTRRNRFLGKIGRKLGLYDPAVTGMELTTGRVAELSAIKNAESPIDELDRQLEEASNTRRNRFLGKIGRKLGLYDPAVTGMELTTGKVARLAELKKSMEKTSSNH